MPLRNGAGVRHRHGAVSLVLVGCLVGFGLVASAGVARAHATLISASPDPGYTAQAVSRVVLAFDEPVTLSSGSLTLVGPSGRIPVAVAPTTSKRLIARLRSSLPDGAYTVSWNVTAADGDVVTGTFSFGVQAAGVGEVSAPLATGRARLAGTAGLPAATVLRWLLFSSLALTLGGLVGQRILERVQAAAEGTLPAWPRPPLLLSAVVGGLAALLLAAHTAGQGAITVGLARGPAGWLSSPAGRIACAEVLLFAVAGVLVRSPWALLATAPLFAITLAEGFRDHLHARWGIAGALLISAHLAAAAVWAGALLSVVLGAGRWRAAGHRRAAWIAVGDYARAAGWLYLLVIATGTAAAVALVGSWAALTGTAYGQILLVKLALVTAVTVLAGTSRLRLGSTPDQQPLPGRFLRIEAAALAGVLAVTALLVSVPAPAEGSPLAALPPPAPVGPVVQLGTLAGNLTIGLAASAGQLRLHVTTPSSDDGDPTPLQVRAALLQPGVSTVRVKLRPCGQGCFAAPVQWRGTTDVQIDASARGWHGGRADLRVPWPPAPGGAALARMFPAMRAIHRFRLHEQVSSDTTRPAGLVTTLTLSGLEFLKAEPYRTAVAGAVLLPDPHRRLRIAFGVGDTFFVELVLDGRGRISAETLTTPNHLIRRTFVYPP